MAKPAALLRANIGPKAAGQLTTPLLRFGKDRRFPQRMGERVAHLLNGRLQDFIKFDDQFALAKLVAPEPIVGITLGMSEIRQKYGVTVVGVKREDHEFIYAVPDTLVFPQDLLVVSGTIDQIERFSLLGAA